ncbi:MAG: hypothetical protein R3C97_18510, partial [Geminicoccaceae bacterium]
GIELSRLAGRAWAMADEAGYAFAAEQGNTITTASDAIVAEFKEKTADIRQTVIERINGLGIDAEAALADLQTLSANAN